MLGPPAFAETKVAITERAGERNLADVWQAVGRSIERRRIRLEHPSACVLILTGSSIAADVERAHQAGVAGFLTKDRLGTQLVDAILELGSE
jgi:DNA-binding NarL/FixJ family response regulator